MDIIKIPKTMHRYNKDLWSLVYLRTTNKLMAFSGLWYHTQLPFQIFSWLLSFWNVWEVLCYFSTIIGLILNVIQPIEDPLHEYAFSLMICIAGSIAYIQYFCYSLRKDLYSRVVKQMEKYLDQSCQIFGKKVIQASFSDGNAQAKMLTKIWLSLWVGTVVHFILLPLIEMIMKWIQNEASNQLTNMTISETNGRIYKHIYKLYFYVDLYQSPFYEITMISEVTSMFFFSLLFAISDSSLWTFLILFRSQIQHLNKIYSGIEFTSNDFNIFDCIKLHQNLFKLYEDFGEFMSPIIFLFCLRCFICFVGITFIISQKGHPCFNLYMLLWFWILKSSILCFWIKIENPLFMSLVEFGFIYLIQLHLCVWFADDVTKESLLTADAIYSCNWQNCGPKEHYAIRFIMERSQKKIRLYGGPYYNLTIQLMINILRQSFSFYTLLTNVTIDS